MLNLGTFLWRVFVAGLRHQLVEVEALTLIWYFVLCGKISWSGVSGSEFVMGWDFTVWQKLEEQNPEFFKAYYTRLKLKKQIMLFNHLLEQQVQLMHKMRLFPVQAPLLQNGMHLTPKTSTITMPISCSIQLAWVWGMCDLFTESPRLCVFSFIPIHFLLYLWHLVIRIAVHHTPMGYPMAQPGGVVPQGHPHMGTMAMPPPSSPLMNGGPAVPENYHPHDADANK